MRLLLTTFWLIAGTALTGGAYWLFLNMPESSALALIASAVLAIVTVFLIAVTINVAIEISTRGLSLTGFAHAVRSVLSVIPAALIVLLVWWLTTTAESWVAMRSGQINAVFIARFGWANIAWLFAAIGYGAIWLRWVIAALLAVSLMGGMLSFGWAALGQSAWLRRALHPRAVAISTVAFIVLIALPWTFLVPWRPRNLPATSVEIVFIGAKLSLSALLAAIGATLIVREAVRKPFQEPAT